MTDKDLATERQCTHVCQHAYVIHDCAVACGDCPFPEDFGWYYEDYDG